MTLTTPPSERCQEVAGMTLTFGRPGTDKHIEWKAIHFYTIRDGKILEDAMMMDALAIMQQLGLAPNGGTKG